MGKGSFAGKVREVLKGQGEMTIDAVVQELGLTLPPEEVSGVKLRPRVYAALRDMCRTGEVERLDTALYRWRGKTRPPRYNEKMWHILRARRIVSLDDLQELTGAGRDYAFQWCRMLERQEMVRRLDDERFQLIHDPVKMPEDDRKRERLRDLRIRKALEAVEQAAAALAQAQEALAEA